MPEEANGPREVLLVAAGLQAPLPHGLPGHADVGPVVSVGGDGHRGDGGEGGHAPDAEDQEAAALAHGH